jgi:hypothetical protein
MTRLALLISLLLSLAAFAAQPKTYQVTGKVLETSADTITVEKGKEKWEIAKGEVANASDIKVGDKVTIEYRMTAAKIEKK